MVNKYGFYTLASPRAGPTHEDEMIAGIAKKTGVCVRETYTVNII